MSNLFQMYQQFKSNPLQYMMNRGINIPQNIQNDPNAIIQYLMNSGRITQTQYNQAAQMAKQMQNQFR